MAPAARILNNPVAENRPSTIINQNVTSLAASNPSRSNNYMLLSTALVKVQANGRDVQCRALLDLGSQLNLVRIRLVKRLGIAPKAASICISGIENFTTRFESAVLPHIISPQPSQSFNIDYFPIPDGITLEDPSLTLLTR